MLKHLLGVAVFGLCSAASAATAFDTEVLFQGEEVIWGFDFLNADEVIFTERKGQFRLLNLKTRKAEVFNVPVKVLAESQGGLLDISLHPDFKKNHWVYFTYSKPMDNGKATTALARFQWEGGQAKGLKDVFVAKAVSDNTVHYGSRIAWTKDNSLFLSVGERNERNKAQDLTKHNGKILHLTEEGGPAAGNPFVGEQNALPEIWTYGHRNPQGLAIHPQTGELYEAEFGPRGGDEINLIVKKKNYGWPVITYGKEYYGPSIGEGTAKEGMEQPLTYWVPSISPSAVAFYSGKKFPQWKNHLFIGCLSGMHLRRIKLQGGNVVEQEELLKEKNWRVRNVKTGPDGYLYVSTDTGILARLKPKE